MEIERRRRLELLRLLVEISADLDALETIARNCDEAHRALAKPSRAVLAMAAVDVHRYYTAIGKLAGADRARGRRNTGTRSG